MVKKILFCTFLVLQACSSSEDSTEEVGTEDVTDADVIDSVEGEETLAEFDTELAEEEGTLSEVSDDSTVDQESPFGATEETADVGAVEDIGTSEGMETTITVSDENNIQASGNGNIINHTVSRGDTLMKIAFRHTGDISRWREVYDLNSSLIRNPNLIYPGWNLRVMSNGFVDSRSGNPYEVQEGETLAEISKKLFGTIDRWRDLYENNSQLIKDPNKIYAGFTIFFPGGGQRLSSN